MLYTEIITVCSQIHTNHINTLYGQKAKLCNVDTSHKYNNHCVYQRICLYTKVNFPITQGRNVFMQ